MFSNSKVFKGIQKYSFVKQKPKANDTRTLMVIRSRIILKQIKLTDVLLKFSISHNGAL